MITVKTEKGSICYSGDKPKFIIKQDDALSDFLVYKIIEQKIDGSFVVRLLPKLPEQETAADFGHATLEDAMKWVGERIENS